MEDLSININPIVQIDGLGHLYSSSQLSRRAEKLKSI